MKKIYSIAGLAVAMDTYGRTEAQAEAYLLESPKDPDIVVDSFHDFLLSKHPEWDDDTAEYLGTAGSFYKELLRFDGFQFHSSAVVVDGKAYLFSANSGTGKSTHTRLWLEMFGEGAYIINDDKPALRLIDGVWYAFGTPWSGKNDISVNTGVPVAGIAFLERGMDNAITPYAGQELILDFLRQSNRPRAPEYRIKLLELFDRLIQAVPIWKLKCNMESEAAIVSYEAMSGKKWRK